MSDTTFSTYEYWGYDGPFYWFQISILFTYLAECILNLKLYTVNKCATYYFSTAATNPPIGIESLEYVNFHTHNVLIQPFKYQTICLKNIYIHNWR